jgi:hypothetical protein
MVRFEDLKTGDRIARRKIEFIDGELVRDNYPAKVVRSVVTNPCGDTRSVWLADSERDDTYGYWLHDMQFSTIQDELNRYDKVL